MASPINKRNLSDPGDQVLRKFGYQHAYGVVLVIAMINKLKDYLAIWCEHHEDLFAERRDGYFDAYQVKTRKSELGEWKITDEAFFNSIRRFVELDNRFPQAITRFYFVSNTRFSNSNSEKYRHLSPIKLLEAIKSAEDYNDIANEQQEGFDLLAEKTESDETVLFNTLKRLDLIVSLTERAYEDELCQRHISTLPQCRSASAPALSAILKSLITLLSSAASLETNNPTRDLIGLIHEVQGDPYLLAKRVSAENAILAIRDAYENEIQFSPDLASIKLGTIEQKQGTLKEKMNRGGLSAHFEAMRRRSITAERNLLDLATRPDTGKVKCSQIENIVLGECDDAYLRASTYMKPIGPYMLIDVQDRLKKIAEERPKTVYYEPYEVLVGVAGLLTSECKVWWSEQFSLEDEK